MTNYNVWLENGNCSVLLQVSANTVENPDTLILQTALNCFSGDEGFDGEDLRSCMNEDILTEGNICGHLGARKRLDALCSDLSLDLYFGTICSIVPVWVSYEEPGDLRVRSIKETDDEPFTDHC